MFFSIRLQEGETLFKITSFATSADFLTRIELQSTQLFLAAVHPPEFLGGARSIQLSYEDLYKIDDFGSIFELTADMSFPLGGWSAITLGGGRSILLSYRNR